LLSAKDVSDLFAKGVKEERLTPLFLYLGSVKSKILGAYQISDDEWEVLREFFPERERCPGPGRPPTGARTCLSAFLLKMGSYVPARKHTLMLGVCYDTLRDRLQEWIEAGVFEKLWGVSVQNYDELVGLKLRDLVIDGCITTARNGGELTGRSPVDRGKKGCKRSVMNEAGGVPLSVVTTAANVNDHLVLAETIMGSIVEIPDDAQLHADLGYDNNPARAQAENCGIELVIPPKEAAKKDRASRHSVENLNQRHNRFFALKHRTERRADYHLAMVLFASSIITWRLCSWALARPRDHARYARLRSPPRE
jgi:IS5 family transposase